MTDVYRSAASILVLRPSEVCDRDGNCKTVYQILLLHKPRKKDSWQLPQGGVEQGETIEQAAVRELCEEAGIGDCQVLGKSPHVYQYDFPPSFRRFRPDNVCGQRIEYVFTVVDANTPVRVDQNEIDSYVWVDISQMPQYVKRKEYIDLVHALYEEALASLKPVS